MAQSCKYQTALCVKLHSEHSLLYASYTSYGHTASISTEGRHDGGGKKKKLEREKDFVLTINMRQWLQITHIL